LTPEQLAERFGPMLDSFLDAVGTDVTYSVEMAENARKLLDASNRRERMFNTIKAAKRAHAENVAKAARGVLPDDSLAARVVALRAADESLQSIAETLQNEGVPTRAARGRWHAQTVKEILARAVADFT
jgi:hypothetical protein